MPCGGARAEDGSLDVGALRQANREVGETAVGITREAFLFSLRSLCDAFAPLSAGQAEELYNHYRLLVRWNPVAGLTSVVQPEEAIRRHYGESLFLASVLPVGELAILDLGSGGGFPGIPIAVWRPECQVWLCERRLKKAAFLREATRSWRNVRVISDVASFPELRFDWVVSRAVRPEEVVRFARGRAGWVGLLVARSGAAALRELRGLAVVAEHPVPWDERRLAVIGQVAAGDVK